MPIKFRKATSPAFNKDEIWVSANGVKVKIISVEKYKGCTGLHSSDYKVLYYTSLDETKTNEKDAWNFQVRYSHSSDIQ